MKIVLWIFGSFISLGVSAQVELNGLFQNHMVFQRDQPIAVFGTAKTENEVKVIFKGKSYSTNVTDNKWKLFLDISSAGGPYNLDIIGVNKITISDILVGEVWICSGQSNMEMPVKGNFGQPINGSNRTILESNNNQLRLFKVEKKIATKPEENISGQWILAEPNSVKNFSATAYFFGKYIQEKLNIPVGLISSSWGGTPAEAWTPKPTLDKHFKDYEGWFNDKSKPQKSPNVLYNGMIHPLIPYSVKGAIWYQGETNKVRAKQYAELFPAMINSWRQLWDQEEFPFYFVQIAPLGWGKNQELLRESQLKTMLTVPNVGMAVTLDIGEKYSIHPAEKQKVGERLAFWALAKTYGFVNIEYSGPVYKSMKIVENKVLLNFDYAELGLSNFGKEMTDFVIAGKDKVFYEAKAEIIKGKLYVWSEKVKEPVAVRYGWSAWVDASLFNTAGLPASSFRTDDW